MNTPDPLGWLTEAKDVHAGSGMGAVSVGVGTSKPKYSEVCQRARALAYKRGKKKRKKEQQ